MSTPIVSVIIPVFNRPRRVVRAVQSVLDQNFTKFEVIIVDDGSSPALQLPDELLADVRVKLVHLDQNRGTSAARNAGVKIARGKWLAWLDSDDLWRPDKLAIQIAYMTKMGAEGQNIALASGIEYLSRSGKRQKRVPVAATDPLLFFSGCWFCPGSTVILSRALFEKVGPYDEDLDRLEDLDWFARMALAGGHLDVVPQILTRIGISKKVIFETAKKAGDQLLAKYNDHKLPMGARQHLLAYLNLEYAASALKRERKLFLGLKCLLTSWYGVPRTRLHLYKFWH